MTFGTSSENHAFRDKLRKAQESSEQLDEYEMSKPYWERKEFHSYKQIKVLQPQLETPVQEYMDIKIKEYSMKSYYIL